MPEMVPFFVPGMPTVAYSTAVPSSVRILPFIVISCAEVDVAANNDMANSNFFMETVFLFLVLQNISWLAVECLANGF